MTMYWLFFVVIFLLPILALTVNWVRNNNENQHQLIATAEGHALKQTTATIDDSLAHIVTTADQMSLDSVFDTVPSAPADYGQIEQALRRYSLSSALIAQIFVNLYRAPATLYATDGTHDTLPTLAKYRLLDVSGSAQQVNAALHPTGPTMVVTPATTKQAGELETLTLVVPLKTAAGGARGVVFFDLNTATLQDLIANSAVSNQQVLGLVTKNRQQILPQAHLGNVALAPLASQSERQRQQQHSPVQIRREKSATGFFELVSYTITTPLTHPVASFFGRYGWLFGLIFGLGGVLIWWFSKRQYSLIRKLELIFPSNASSTLVPSEAVRLQQAIEAYITNHQDLILTSKSQLPFVRNQILQLILNGRTVDPEVIARFLKVAAIQFSHPNFMLALVDTPLDWETSGVYDPISTSHYTVFLMYRVTQEQLVLLINYDTGQDIDDIISELRQQVAFIAPEMAFYLSRSVQELAELHDAYIEVISTQITTHPRSGETVTYDSAHDCSLLGEDLFDFTSELKLDNSLLQHNFTHSHEAFEKLFNLASQNYDAHARFDLGMSNLITRILKADYQKSGQVNDELVAQLLLSESLSQIHSILLRTITEITSETPQVTLATLGDDRGDIGEQLKQYILTNVCSPTLSLVDIADHFDFSVPYTSRYIKSVTGKTFTEFVTERRLTMIQQALITTELPIKTIIEQHGYYDVASFTRKFKKMTGITPGGYRRLHQAKLEGNKPGSQKA